MRNSFCSRSDSCSTLLVWWRTIVAGTLTVTGQPMLSNTPAAVSLTGTYGEASVMQSVQLASTNGSVGFTASSNVSWLTVTVSGVNTPATLQIQANPADLGAATYQGAVVIAGASAVNSPYSILVAFTVNGTAG